MSQGTLKKVKFNFIFGIIGQFVTLAIGIIIPRLFITNFGSDVNGYINSINQVLAYFALLESGVGSASIQALYSPVANQEKNKINGILSATSNFYKKIAFIYLFLNIILSFIYPLLIETKLSYSLMVGIFLITGGSGAIPYFFHAKYKLFLSVNGKEYITTIITTLYQILLSLGKAILLFMGFNVLVIQSLYLVLNILQAIIFTIYIKRKYVWLNLKVTPNKSAISKSKFALIHQLSGFVFNNTDVLILTFFCDLKTVSIYALYKTFIGIIGTLITHFSNSLKFRLGQLFENRETFLKLHDAYETLHISLTFSLCAIAYLFFSPFLSLYTDGMDTNYVLKYMPLLVCSIETLTCARIPSQNIIAFAGHFKETGGHAILESIINLSFSLVLVKIYGIYGVLLGTVAALLYRVNAIIIYSNRKILKRSPLPVYKLFGSNILISGFFVFVVKHLNLPTANYFQLIISAAVVCVVSVPLQIILNFIIHRSSRQFAKNIIKKVLKIK